jgi:hypothetical protein
MPTEREIGEEFLVRTTTWKRSHLTNRAVWGLLALAGVASGLTVSTYESVLDENFIRLLGLLSAVSSASITLFQPREHADRFLTAWRRLDQACIEYKYNDAVPLKTITDAMKDGERMIGISSK